MNPISRYELLQRSASYPSLSPMFLSVHAAASRPLMQNYYRMGQETSLSSRFNAVIADMLKERETDPFAKFVIFSQYGPSLTEFKARFERYNQVLLAQENAQFRPFEAVVVDSSIGSSRERDRRISAFKDDPATNVILLGTGLAATGLTLTAAHVCFILGECFCLVCFAADLGCLLSLYGTPHRMT